MTISPKQSEPGTSKSKGAGATPALQRVSVAPQAYLPTGPTPDREVSVKDAQNPHSLINLLTGPLRAAVEHLPDELLLMDEARLKRHCDPGELECRLRIQFWDEWNQACDEGRPMSVSAIMRGICYAEYFYQVILPDPKKLAWVIKPPADFLLAMRDLLYLGMSRLREILELPLVDRTPMIRRGAPVLDDKGQIVMIERPNVRLIAEVRTITEMMQNRVHGAVIQRVHQKTQLESQNLHLIAGTDPLAQLPTDLMLALDKQLQGVNARLEAVEALPPPPADFVEATAVAQSPTEALLDELIKKGP